MKVPTIYFPKRGDVFDRDIPSTATNPLIRLPNLPVRDESLFGAYFDQTNDFHHDVCMWASRGFKVIWEHKWLMLKAATCIGAFMYAKKVHAAYGSYPDVVKLLPGHTDVIKSLVTLASACISGLASLTGHALANTALWIKCGLTAHSVANFIHYQYILRYMNIDPQPVDEMCARKKRILLYYNWRHALQRD